LLLGSSTLWAAARGEELGDFVRPGGLDWFAAAMLKCVALDSVTT
jgi:hypothetical protein